MLWDFSELSSFRLAFSWFRRLRSSPAEITKSSDMPLNLGYDIQLR
jgi:hypothetical protein